MLSYYKDYIEFMEDVIIYCVEKVCLNDDKGIKIGNGWINYVFYYGVYYFVKFL